MTNGFAIYGFPDECRKFDDRHPLWQEIMPNLERALNIAFTRVQVMGGSADKFVYFFGKVCLEDKSISISIRPTSRLIDTNLSRGAVGLLSAFRSRLGDRRSSLVTPSNVLNVFGCRGSDRSIRRTVSVGRLAAPGADAAAVDPDLRSGTKAIANADNVIIRRGLAI
jgi:hypothetical protein